MNIIIKPITLPFSFSTNTYPFSEGYFNGALNELESRNGDSFAGVAMRCGTPGWISPTAVELRACTNSRLLFTPEIDTDVIMLYNLASTRELIDLSADIYSHYDGRLHGKSMPSLRAFIGNDYKTRGKEIVFDQGRGDLNPEFLERWKRNLGALNAYCDKRKVALLLENHPILKMHDMEAIGGLLDSGEYPFIKLLADPANCANNLPDANEAFNEAYWKGRTGGIHIKQVRDGKPLSMLDEEGGDLEMPRAAEMVRNLGGGFAAPYFTIIETAAQAGYSFIQCLNNISKNMRYLQGQWEALSNHHMS